MSNRQGMTVMSYDSDFQVEKGFLVQTKLWTATASHRMKLQSLVETASLVKNCTLMKDVVKLIQDCPGFNQVSFSP